MERGTKLQRGAEGMRELNGGRSQGPLAIGRVHGFYLDVYERAHEFLVMGPVCLYN